MQEAPRAIIKLITFKQHLDEIFDKPLKFRWISKNSNAWKGTFETQQEITFLVKMEKYLSDWFRPPEYSWQVSFDVFNRTDDKFGLTGKGESLAVFSTVISMMKEWIKKEKPNMIDFSAKEASRKKLYLSFTERIAPKLGYKLLDAEDTPAGLILILKRK